MFTISTTLSCNIAQKVGCHTKGDINTLKFHFAGFRIWRNFMKVHVLMDLQQFELPHVSCKHGCNHDAVTIGNLLKLNTSYILTVQNKVEQDC